MLSGLSVPISVKVLGRAPYARWSRPRRAAKAGCGCCAPLVTAAGRPSPANGFPAPRSQHLSTRAVLLVSQNQTHPVVGKYDLSIVHLWEMVYMCLGCIGRWCYLRWGYGKQSSVAKSQNSLTLRNIFVPSSFLNVPKQTWGITVVLPAAGTGRSTLWMGMVAVPGFGTGAVSYRPAQRHSVLPGALPLPLEGACHSSYVELGFISFHLVLVCTL